MIHTNQPSDTIGARLLDLIDPLQLLLISFYFLPKTLFLHPLLLFKSPKGFQSAWFANMWETLGPQMAVSPIQTPYITDLFSRARGVVLELGPGTGEQMRHLITPVQNGAIERMVAAEPNARLHERLVRNAKGIGLDAEKGRFTALVAGAEPTSLIPALHKAGLYPVASDGDGPEGLFDTVVTIKSMCSVPQHQMSEIVSTIHTLLRPGGEFLFFEHVANDTNYLTMAWVWLLNLLWPVAMGGCHLNGRVDKVVQQMGDEWESIDVRNTKEFMGWNCFRYVSGVCKKGEK